MMTCVTTFLSSFGHGISPSGDNITGANTMYAQMRLVLKHLWTCLQSFQHVSSFCRNLELGCFQAVMACGFVFGHV